MFVIVFKQFYCCDARVVLNLEYVYYGWCKHFRKILTLSVIQQIDQLN